MIDTTIRGIDVSVYQGSIEWTKVRASGIRFAMLKASQGRSVTNASLYLFRDSTFLSNVRGASSAGVLCGAYHYLTAQTAAEAVKEAEYFLSVIKPYADRLSLGAAVDVEDSRLPSDRDALTAIVRAFCGVVKRAGFDCMVYTNPDFLTYRLGNLSEYGLWLALWRDKNRLPASSAYPNLRIWQWGRETVNGISASSDGVSAAVDADFADGTWFSSLSVGRTEMSVDKAETFSDDKAENVAEEPDYAAEVCRIAGLSGVTRTYLEKYTWSADLFRKLYRAMKTTK